MAVPFHLRNRFEDLRKEHGVVSAKAILKKEYIDDLLSHAQRENHINTQMTYVLAILNAMNNVW